MRRLVSAFFVLSIVTAAFPTAAGRPRSDSPFGTGTVFLPNPVAELGDQTLTDQKDADYPALASAYHDVVLTNLDGSGFLKGDWAQIVSETGDPAYSTTNDFRYRRNDDRFEQVMAYYWITEAQKYIQSLGFGTTRRPVNKRAQQVRINQWGLDNSFATDKKDELRFGKGGVDDAEDADVVLHEYGHAIHFAQGFVFGSVEAGAISEGFGDYWAATVTDIVAPTSDSACVGDWDSVAYTLQVPHCLRRIDRNLRYPADLRGQVHFDGQIWSRALWDIRRAIGHVKADTVILEAQFGFPGTTMSALAAATVETARQVYGNAVAAQVRTVFVDRGLL